MIRGIVITMACIMATMFCGTAFGEETITVGGGTTLLPIVEKAGAEFSKANPGVKVVVGGGGTPAGVSGAGEGKLSIGMAGRMPTDAEKATYPDLVAAPIATDGLAIVVNKANPVTAITKEQVQKVFTGQIKNWKELGGNDSEIILVGEMPQEATIGLFMKYFGLEAVLDDNKNVKFTLKGEPNGAAGLASASENVQKIIGSIATKPNSISFISLAIADDLINKGGKITKLTLDGVEPTSSLVKAGKYPISRPLVLVTKGEPTGNTKGLMDFILSPAGQKIVESLFFVPIK